MEVSTALVLRAAERLQNRFMVMVMTNIVIPCDCFIGHMFPKMYYYLFFNLTQETVPRVETAFIIFVSNNEIEVE